MAQPPKPPKPTDVAAAMFSRDTASRGLGMCIERVRAHYARLSMPVRDDMLNGHAICHGGFIFTLADSAFAFACNSTNIITVAAGADISFVAPARAGDVLTATCRVRHGGAEGGGRSGVYDTMVKNQRGETIALFRGRSRQLRGAVLEENSTEEET